MLLTREPFRISPLDRRLAGPVAIVGIWTIVAVAAAVQAVALVRLDGRADVVGAILSRLSIIPLWAIATPLILRSARRFPVVVLQRQVSATALGVHFALASVFVILTNALIRVAIAFAPVTSGGGVDALLRSTMQGVAEYYPPALVVYGVIVAIGHVVHRPRRGPESASPLVRSPAEPTVAGVAPVESPAPVSAATVVAPTVPIDAHLAVRQWNRVHLVRVEDIDFVEAEDNYVVVHAASRTYKGRDRIRDVESQLDARRFVRIHRSTIVHVAKIREVQPLTHGDHAVVLRDGRVLRVARSRREALGQALGLTL